MRSVHLVSDMAEFIISELQASPLILVSMGKLNTDRAGFIDVHDQDFKELGDKLARTFEMTDPLLKEWILVQDG